MLHRSGIQMIDANAPPAEILSQCLESPHTRLPVFKDEPKHHCVIHAKTCCAPCTNRSQTRMEAFRPDRINIVEVAKEPYFVPRRHR